MGRLIVSLDYLHSHVVYRVNNWSVIHTKNEIEGYLHTLLMHIFGFLSSIAFSICVLGKALRPMLLRQPCYSIT